MRHDFQLILTLLAAGAAAPAQASSLLAIDIGHSTLHPGAISSRGQSEFEFNASLARVVEATLAAHHVRSMLIGADGSFDELPQRTQAAENGGATFLLSIHHDSAQPQYFEKWTWQGADRSYSDRFFGFSLFVSRKNPQAEKSLYCAGMIGAALRRSGLTASQHHAEKIAGENREWADHDNGVYYHDDLVVLKTAKTPAVLLEAGVIVNRAEEEALQNPAMRNAIAAAIFQGLSACGAIK